MDVGAQQKKLEADGRAQLRHWEHDHHGIGQVVHHAAHHHHHAHHLVHHGGISLGHVFGHGHGLAWFMYRAIRFITHPSTYTIAALVFSALLVLRPWRWIPRRERGEHREPRAGSRRGVGTVYLVHLERAFEGCRHYIGFTRNLDARMMQHRSGDGAQFLRRARAAGVDFDCVRTWKGTTSLERYAKSRGARWLCPRCTTPPQELREGQA